MLAKGFFTKLFASTRLTGRGKRLLFLKSHITVLICEKIRANRPHACSNRGCMISFGLKRNEHSDAVLMIFSGNDGERHEEACITCYNRVAL